MSRLSIVCAIVTILPLVGCGGNAKPYPTAKVAGVVTIDAKPIESGTINFIAAQGTGEASAEIKAGAFAAQDVPKGNVRVFVIATQETGKMVPGSSEPVPEVISIVPAHYAQGIEIQVAGDEANRQIELTSVP